MNTCEKTDRIIDAECCYTEGKFCMGRLPGCLPDLFTLRFTAPADFTSGDVVVVKKREYPLMTSQMELAGTGVFKAGAVLLCEIDRNRDIAFIRTGGDSCACEEVAFQTSDLVYYIDPNGDDSIHNPGGMDSPFKTLAGAGRAAWQNIVMNPFGRLTFSFNPGTYLLTTVESQFMTEGIHPLRLTYRGTTSEKPLLIADNFICQGGFRHFENMSMVSTGYIQTIVAHYNAGVWLRDIEVIAAKPDSWFIASYGGSSIRCQGSLKLNGKGYSLKTALAATGSFINFADTTVVVESLPALSDSFATCDGGYIFADRASFSGSTVGKRYNIIRNGIINSNNSGPNYFPGTIAGTTATGGLYT